MKNLSGQNFEELHICILGERLLCILGKLTKSIEGQGKIVKKSRLLPARFDINVCNWLTLKKAFFAYGNGLRVWYNRPCISRH